VVVSVMPQVVQIAESGEVSLGYSRRAPSVLPVLLLLTTLCLRCPLLSPQTINVDSSETEYTLTPMHESSVKGVRDMITLYDMHEKSLKHNLWLRYKQDLIYVRTLVS